MGKVKPLWENHSTDTTDYAGFMSRLVSCVCFRFEIDFLSGLDDISPTRNHEHSCKCLKSATWYASRLC